MQEMVPVPGGVCAPQGFSAAGAHCGIAKNADKKDLALIFSRMPCACAAVYTQNKVKGAPIGVTKIHIADGKAQAVVVNSGNANTCNEGGSQVAEEMCRLAAEQLSISPKDVVVASTGVIGVPLDIAPIRTTMPALAQALSESGSRDCMQAIMTTDTVEKELSVSFQLDGKLCKIGGIAKGSGMIHINMATMLAFLTTDVNITPIMLQAAMDLVVQNTFNMVSVDGDTSTNDMAVILANGMAGNARIEVKDAKFDAFVAALSYVCIYLSRMLAKDGEGATKLLECSVTGAPDEKTARVLAKSVITSNLFKAAMYGADANWGRVLCAMGYSGAEFNPAKVAVSFASSAGEVQVCEKGVGVPFSEEMAKKILLKDDIEIRIDLGQGTENAIAWGCDLTYDYVKINGDYRS